MDVPGGSGRPVDQTPTQDPSYKPEDPRETARHVRHLMDTIAALRESLDKSRIERHDFVRESMAAARSEIALLHETATALRELLEEERLERQAAVREAVQGSQAEIAQLKATINALREALEARGASS